MIGVIDAIIVTLPFSFGGNVLYAAIAGGVIGLSVGILREIARRRRLKELKKIAKEAGIDWEQFVSDCKKLGNDRR